MNKDFNNWFAGLVDGEGSFLLSVVKDNRNGVSRFRPQFKLSLRSDDGLTLLYIKQELKIGRLSKTQSKTNQGGSISQTGIVFEVDNKSDCTKLLESLEGNLHSKKLPEFNLWSEAVKLINEFGGGETSQVKGRLLEIREQLQFLKKFDETKSEIFLKIVG